MLPEWKVSETELIEAGDVLKAQPMRLSESFKNSPIMTGVKMSKYSWAEDTGSYEASKCIRLSLF